MRSENTMWHILLLKTIEDTYMQKESKTINQINKQKVGKRHKQATKKFNTWSPLFAWSHLATQQQYQCQNIRHPLNAPRSGDFQNLIICYQHPLQPQVPKSSLAHFCSSKHYVPKVGLLTSAKARQGKTSHPCLKLLFESNLLTSPFNPLQTIKSLWIFMNFLSASQSTKLKAVFLPMA